MSPNPEHDAYIDQVKVYTIISHWTDDWVDDCEWHLRLLEALMAYLSKRITQMLCTF
jgi:hypothetical protein